MAGFCLDTDIIVNIIRGKQPLASNYLGACTTIITILELYYGAYKTGKNERILIVDSLRKDLPVIDIVEEDAKLGGKIMAELEREGTKLDFRDVIIGAICINRNLSVVTKNIKHFERMKKFGLIVASQ